MHFQQNIYPQYNVTAFFLFSSLTFLKQIGHSYILPSSSVSSEMFRLLLVYNVNISCWKAGGRHRTIIDRTMILILSFSKAKVFDSELLGENAAPFYVLAK